MTLRTAAHTAGAVEGAVDARLDAVALWALQGPGPLDVRTGVVYAPGNPMQVLGTSATSPWAVTVNPGHTVAKKSGVSNGVYYNCNDALTTVALAVPPASNSRIDTIYAMQLDAAALVDVDGSTAAVIGAVTGTSGNGGLGATPSVPAVPVGAYALYSVQILSTATAGTSGVGVTITRLFLWTATRGDPIPVLSAAERNALTGYAGLQALRLDVAGQPIDSHNGTVWVDGDTGWILASLTAGWTGITNNLPVYRRKGGIVYLGGQATSTALGGFAFTLPAGFCPAYQMTQWTDASGVQVRGQVTVTGSVGQTVAAAVTAFSFAPFTPFPADA